MTCRPLKLNLPNRSWTGARVFHNKDENTPKQEKLRTIELEEVGPEEGHLVEVVDVGQD